MATTTSRPQRTALPLTASLAVDRERLQRMSSMRPVERDAAARRGEFSLGEMLAWASRAPNEVELVNGEFWFIAERLADNEVPPARRVAPARPTRRSAR